MEFAIHCVAFNLRRARSLKALRRAAVFVFLAGRHGLPGRVLGVALVYG